MAIRIVTNAKDNVVNTPLIEGSFRWAVVKCGHNDVVKFAPELLGQTIPLLRGVGTDKDITIDGENIDVTLSGRGQNTILGTSGDNRVFNLKNITIADGYREKYSASGLTVSGKYSKVRIEGCTFKNNKSGLGGAVWVTDRGEVTILNSQFTNNKSTEKVDTSAGAVAIHPKSKLLIEGSTFIGNGGASGGAVSAIFSEVTVKTSTFANNNSYLWGGGLHVDGASVPLSPGYYSGNLPRDTVGGKILVEDTIFQGNKTNGWGGGCDIWGYDQDFVVIKNCTFKENSVNLRGTEANGGGLRVCGRQVSVIGSLFHENYSANEGGGMWHQGESPAAIEKCAFTRNAARKGGGLFTSQWAGMGTTIASTHFEDNVAEKGGAIFKEWQRFLVLLNCSFLKNSSQFGGDGRRVSVNGTAVQLPDAVDNAELLTPAATPNDTVILEPSVPAAIEMTVVLSKDTSRVWQWDYSAEKWNAISSQGSAIKPVEFSRKFSAGVLLKLSNVWLGTKADYISRTEENPGTMLGGFFRLDENGLKPATRPQQTNVFSSLASRILTKTKNLLSL